MTTKRKTAKKKKAADPSEPTAPRALPLPTLVHLTYQKEAGIVRANILQDVTIAGVTQRHGRDVDIAVADLDADILSALDDAFKWIADDLDVNVF